MTIPSYSKYQPFPFSFAETDIIKKIQVSVQIPDYNRTYSVRPSRKAFFFKNQTYDQMETYLRMAYRKNYNKENSPITAVIPLKRTLKTISKKKINLVKEVRQWFENQPELLMGIPFSNRPIILQGNDPVLREAFQQAFAQIRTDETLKREFINAFRKGFPETQERNLFVQETIQKLQQTILNDFTERFGQRSQIDQFTVEVLSENNETKQRLRWHMRPMVNQTHSGAA